MRHFSNYLLDDVASGKVKLNEDYVSFLINSGGYMIWLSLGALESKSP